DHGTDWRRNADQLRSNGHKDGETMWISVPIGSLAAYRPVRRDLTRIGVRRRGPESRYRIGSSGRRTDIRARCRSDPAAELSGVSFTGRHRTDVADEL